MKTAEQILKAKGYDNFQAMDIIQANEDSLDRQTREYYKIEEPIHLWEAYYRGDASEEVLEAKAKENGFDDIDTLLRVMDVHLLSLAEEFPKLISVDFGRPVAQYGNSVALAIVTSETEEKASSILDNYLDQNYPELGRMAESHYSEKGNFYFAIVE